MVFYSPKGSYAEILVPGIAVFTGGVGYHGLNAMMKPQAKINLFSSKSFFSSIVSQQHNANLDGQVRG